MTPTLSYGQSFGTFQPATVSNTPLSFGSLGSGGGNPLSNLFGFSTSSFPVGTPVNADGQVMASNGSTGSWPGTPQFTPQPQINVGNMDGSSGFSAALAGLGSAVLQSMGVRPDAPQPMAQPASFSQGGQGGGIDLLTLALIGAAGFGVYWIATS